jgi:hypothetical protein
MRVLLNYIFFPLVSTFVVFFFAGPLAGNPTTFSTSTITLTNPMVIPFGDCVANSTIMVAILFDQIVDSVTDDTGVVYERVVNDFNNQWFFQGSSGFSACTTITINWTGNIATAGTLYVTLAPFRKTRPANRIVQRSGEGEGSFSSTINLPTATTVHDCEVLVVFLTGNTEGDACVFSNVENPVCTTLNEACRPGPQRYDEVIGITDGN